MPFALGSTPMDNTTLRRALTQRNQATACAILSLVISLALIMNTFLSHRKDLVEAHQQILSLQNDITNVQNALRANQQELVQTQEALRREIDANAKVSVITRREAQLWVEWISSRDQAQLSGAGAGVAISAAGTNRGNLNKNTGNQIIYAGDTVTFRPVLRTLDGNGQSVRITITGPGSTNATKTVVGLPRVLGSDSWLYDDFMLTMSYAGAYTVTVAGSIVWPSKTFVVTYDLMVSERPPDQKQ